MPTNVTKAENNISIEYISKERWCQLGVDKTYSIINSIHSASVDPSP